LLHRTLHAVDHQRRLVLILHCNAGRMKRRVRSILWGKPKFRSADNRNPGE
jgi:hypothetical protein